ncbi:MAG: Integrase catalytic region [Candidatus Gottesmanbacteria bacterium GW2011_GWA2_42_16]|nr:MAG: Integrase catalytic region [Candidatus Gottesmanbacteria bacterium GW2011_GWA2_42_16]
MKNPRQFKQLDQLGRDRIHALYGNGHNQKEVALVLGVDPSTISRELARYGRSTWRYSAVRAQADADLKRSQSKRPGMKIETNPELKRYIITQLKRLRAPDEIAGRMKKAGAIPRIGTNAIYKWLYSPPGQPYCQYLCTKNKHKKKQSRLGKRILIPDRISLRQRPNEPGLVHGEGDLFVSPTKTHDKTSGLVVVIPETHLLTGNLIPNKTKLVIVPAVQKITSSLFLDDCTFDNGIENIHHREFGVPSYFCDRGAPWQKPHIESSIGLIRRWFLPKGTKLGTVTDEIFQSQLHLFNGKWRKSLGYRSAYEASLERGIISRVPRISLKKAIAFR